MKIKVRMFDPGKDEKARWETFKVPFKPTMRVLDALKYIQDNIDGTLSFRWNCRTGLCGSCAMEVNGVPVLTCKTELKYSHLNTYVAPLKAFPVVKDLVADYSPAYDREKRMDLFFKPEKQKKGFMTMHDEEIADAKTFRSCIECFICNDTCRPFRDNNNFLGPKSIVKALAYDLHPKDKGNRSGILKKEGIWHCNLTRCCQNLCPQGIPISDEGILPALKKAKK